MPPSDQIGYCFLNVVVAIRSSSFCRHMLLNTLISCILMLKALLGSLLFRSPCYLSPSLSSFLSLSPSLLNCLLLLGEEGVHTEELDNELGRHLPLPSCRTHSSSQTVFCPTPPPRVCSWSTLSMSFVFVLTIADGTSYFLLSHSPNPINVIFILELGTASHPSLVTWSN